jgi:tetratricopeptide (TPR) repeat protein
VQFFRILLGQKVDEAIAYFQQKLDAEPDEQDQQMIAYVLVDLLSRTGRIDAAIQVAEKHLRFVDEQSFSFAELCLKAGRADAWAAAAKEKGDLVAFTAALLAGK